MEEHPQARFIVEKLAQAGFVAYYAGGWVRDFLLQHPSDDIDIATNAAPETIQALFPHTVPIGIAFGIILVIVDGHPYEVATFRQDIEYRDGRRPTKIAFATAEEDAQRRDFTINGLFYDPLKGEILDFVGGRKDLERGIIRAIGNPEARIREDRLRMLRALRLSCRFNFPIEEKTRTAIMKEAHHLRPAVAMERISQELEKAKSFGKLHLMLTQMVHFSLLTPIFPELAHTLPELLEERLSPLHLYPENAPLIAFLLPLFPNASLQEEIALCKKLKLSGQEENFLLFLARGKTLLQKKSPPLQEWAHFYAHPSSATALRIFSAHEEDPQKFLLAQEEKIKKLRPAIARIEENRPLVSSACLMEQGVLPGKQLGALLKEAERISIDEGLEDQISILERLKHSSLWPK